MSRRVIFASYPYAFWTNSIFYFIYNSDFILTTSFFNFNFTFIQVIN